MNAVSPLVVWEKVLGSQVEVRRGTEQYWYPGTILAAHLREGYAHFVIASNVDGAIETVQVAECRMAMQVPGQPS